MPVISSPTYDPATTAKNLATSYIAGTKQILDDANSVAGATSTALGVLSSAMNAFQSALAAMSATGASVSATSATFSNSAVASATATSAATSGTYSFYVERLATAGQVSYGGLTDSVAAGAGNLNVTLADGSNFQIDLANADKNFDGTLSAKEIAAAINIAAGNNSRVTASTLNVNGSATLVLTSTQTGAAGGATLDTSGVGDANLKAQLDDPANKKQIVTAQDAVLWVGAQTTGTKIEQASNVFSVIDDVKITLGKAQLPGDSPVTLTVAPDANATSSKVQAFVDAYNKLNTALNTVTAHGDLSAANPVASAPFATDSGVASLRGRITTALRAVTGGLSLVSFGIKGERDGSLTLDTARLSKAVVANPGSLDSLFGKASPGAESGVLGSLDTLMRQWTSSANGQLTTRSSSVTKQQSQIVNRQVVLQTQYDSAYKRYLAQFTALQSLQSQLTSTSNLFTALFSNSSS
jgi:flagellar hook-associated protein 2